MLPETKQNLSEYLTIKEASELLGVSTWTLRNWDKAGKLKPGRHPMNGYRIYRHQDIEAILPASLHTNRNDNSSAPDVDWTDMGKSEHFVQFYENDTALADSVSAFIAVALKENEGAVIVATEEHRKPIERKLKAQEIDVSAALTRGQYVCLDAAETLSKFMVDKMPDRQRFNQAVGEIIAQVTEKYGHLRAFGEMVALLWDEGNRQAALRLEEYWNELGKTHAFSLFCAYPLKAFTDIDHGEHFGDVCGCHSKVIPAENYAGLMTPEQRLRAISRLQQKAASLEAEIEHRKEVEKSLLQREGELNDFFENAAEGIHKVGPDGIILWANKAELKLLGYEAEEYIGHHIAEFHADEEVIEDILKRLKSGETLKDHEARLRSRNGVIKDVVIHSNVYWEGGKFLYSHCFTRDITERKLAEETKALLAAVVESSQDAIISKTLDGRILSWNSSAERLFGCTADKAIGQPITMVIPLDRRDEEHRILDRLRRGHRIEHYETVRVSKSGHLIDISLTVSPVHDSKGRIIGASKVVRDITEQKCTEKELQNALKKAQDASIAKSEFLTNMSHELRTPLNAVIGLANLLHPDLSLEKQAEFIKTLQLSAGQLLQLINDLLDVSKLETQQMQLERIPFNIEEIMAEMISIHSVKAQEKGIELIFLPESSPVAEVTGDPLRFRQVLMNLLSNAIKFTDQGSVTVNVECEMHPSDETIDVRVDVADTGIGIAKDKLDTLFSKFSQGDTSISRKYGGTGLGLSITKTLVELMGGDISVHSEIGKGSCFSVIIPFYKGQDPATADTLPTTALFNNPFPSAALRRHVLLAEDYPANILVVTTMLEMLGCSYEVVGTGKQALERIKQQHFDLVFMDVQMPEMDGLMATQLLRKWEAETGKPRIPVVGMTAHALQGDRERCLQSGMDDYISKPFKQEELEQRLESIA